MKADSLAADIERRLREALAPLVLDLRDDSARHAGHAGAAAGRHYVLRLVSTRFAGLSRLQRHRLVYDALGPLFQSGIHALSMTLQAPDETR